MRPEKPGHGPAPEDFYVTVKGEKHRGIQIAEPVNDGRARVYFEVPSEIVKTEIYLQDSEEEETLTFLYEGNYSVDQVRKKVSGGQPGTYIYSQMSGNGFLGKH